MSTSTPIDFADWLKQHAYTLPCSSEVPASFPPYRHPRPAPDLRTWSDLWENALDEREARLATARDCFVDLQRKLKSKDNLLNEQAELISERDSEIDQLRSDVKTLRDQGAFGEKVSQATAADRDYWQGEAKRLASEAKFLTQDRDNWRQMHADASKRVIEIRETKKAFAAKAREAERKVDELQDQVDKLARERAGDDEFLGKLGTERYYQHAACDFRVLRDGALQWQKYGTGEWVLAREMRTDPKTPAYTYYETDYNYWRVNATGAVEAFGKESDGWNPLDKWLSQSRVKESQLKLDGKQISYHDLPAEAKTRGGGVS